MEATAGFDLAAPDRAEGASLDATRRRLRAHAARVLAAASVSESDRADIAEELYGHLWQRWQAGIAAGRGESEAADEAMRSFGASAPIALALTEAYRGRLYASTIGVLLPIVTPDAERPGAIRALAALLVFVAGFMAVVGSATYLSMSPVRAVAGEAVVVLAVALDLLAALALLRGQRWALLYARFTAVALIASGIATSWAKLTATPATIEMPLLATAGALLAPWAFGRGCAAWVSGSRSLGRALGVGLVAVVALTSAGTSLAAALPDPTQAGPSALDFRLAVACTYEANGDVAEVAITTDATWSRTDLLPLGPFGTGTKRDEVAVWVDGTPSLDSTWEVGQGTSFAAWSLHGTTIDYAAGEAARPDPTDIGWSSADVSPTVWSRLDDLPSAADAPLTNAVPDIDFAQSIKTDAIRADHRYHSIWRGGAWGFIAPPHVDRIIAVYNHAGRFAKRAEATCGATSEGVEAPVAIP